MESKKVNGPMKSFCIKPVPNEDESLQDWKTKNNITIDYLRKLSLSFGPGWWFEVGDVFIYLYISELRSFAALRFIYHIWERSYHLSSYHCSCSIELKMQRWLYTAPVLIAILLWKPKGKSFVDKAIKILCIWLIMQLYIGKS
jgi:hypothetical protein